MNLITALPYLNPIYTHQPEAFILKRFLRRYNIKVDSDLLHQKLLEHPYFPSLLSISEVLTSLNVSNESYKIELTSLKENFETPILIHVNIGSGEFCILDKIKNDKYKILTENGESKWLDESAFKKVWEGVILNVDISDTGEEINNVSDNSYPIYIKYLSAFFLSITTFYIFQIQVLDLSLKLLLALNTVGVLISWLLVLQHLNKNNALVQQLCESKTQEGCGTVLSSKTAQLTPWFSMAEAGFVYFAGVSLVILFFNSYSSVYLLSLLAPVFSLYAIYLQAFVIKQWCRLCMAVHTVIFLSFASSVYSYWGTTITLPSVGEVIIFLLPGLLWLFIKPYIKLLKDAKHYQAEYARLKYNPEVFLALVINQPKINIPQSLKVFILGNSEAEHELTFVSNPFCGPCANAHIVINEWLNHKINFKINFIFIHSTDKNDKKRIFTEHISGIQNQKRLEVVLHNWYIGSNKDTQKWADNHKLKPSTLLYKDESLQNWLETADVHSTPTFFLNGYRLPETYRIADIRHLIQEVPLRDSDIGSPSLGI